MVKGLASLADKVLPSAGFSCSSCFVDSDFSLRVDSDGVLVIGAELNSLMLSAGLLSGPNEDSFFVTALSSDFDTDLSTEMGAALSTVTIAALSSERGTVLSSATETDLSSGLDTGLSFVTATALSSLSRT